MNRKRKLFLGGIFCTALLCWSACGRQEPEINRNMPDDAQPIVVPTMAPARDPSANANGANLNANIPAFPNEATNPTTVTELQDSVITSTNDNLGNRIETRVFRAHLRLSQVVVITTKDKKKSARVYGNRGEVRELPRNLLENVLILSGDDLANAVGIAMDKAPKQTTTQLPVLEKSTPTPKPAASPTPKPTATPTPPPVEPE